MIKHVLVSKIKFDCFLIMLFPRWISVGSDLKFDARRDMDDVGAMCVQGSH